MLDHDDLTPPYFVEEPQVDLPVDAVTVPAEPTTGKAGRPPKPVDREVVIKLARLHITQEDIARWFGVTRNVISERFGEDIKLAQAETRARLRRKMLEQALAGNTTMLIWLGKNMCMMSDNGPMDHDDNKPLPWSDE
jgi:hypothetical protein